MLGKDAHTGSRAHLYYALWAAFFCGLCIFGVSAAMLVGFWRENAVARDEYAYLRTVAEAWQPVRHAVCAVPSPAAHTESPPVPSAEQMSEPSPTSCAAAALRDINADFVGWIYVSGTAVDYPVVQADCNEFYLDRTFMGTQGPAGTIFLDYRAPAGLLSPVALLYGHNMRDGSMFASLAGLRTDAAHTITIAAQDGVFVYDVFLSLRTDAFDAVYSLDFGCAYGAAAFFGRDYAPDMRFVVLSTCIGHTGSTARLVVAAAFVPTY